MSTIGTINDPRNDSYWTDVFTNDTKFPLNDGDTAFVLICSALVMLMTPGLAQFYGGMVRTKNMINTMMLSAITMGIILNFV